MDRVHRSVEGQLAQSSLVGGSLRSKVFVSESDGLGLVFNTVVKSCAR